MKKCALIILSVGCTILALLSIALPVQAQAPGGGAPAKKLPTPVGVAEVTSAADQESRRYTGLVVSQSVVQIVPRVSGEILEVGFSDGSVVQEGQVLYRLDDTQYVAAVKSAEAKIAECKAKLEYCLSNFKRFELLYKQNATTLDNYENSKSALEANRASLLAAEAELITANDNLKNTVITAPLEGIAGVTNYTRGNYITPSSGTLITIIQVQPVRVRFSVSSSDFLKMFGSLKTLKEEAFVELKLADGSIYPQQGVIEFLNNEANSKTDAIQVFASFPNQDFQLVVGSTVSVTLAKKTGRTVLAVLPSAVMHDSDGSYVYVVESTDHKIAKRYVELGNATRTQQMIESGLEIGESVVVQGTHKVSVDMEVEPVPFATLAAKKSVEKPITL